jgi:hypothetical protein
MITMTLEDMAAYAAELAGKCDDNDSTDDARKRRAIAKFLQKKVSDAKAQATFTAVCKTLGVSPKDFHAAAARVRNGEFHPFSSSDPFPDGPATIFGGAPDPGPTRPKSPFPDAPKKFDSSNGGIRVDGKLQKGEDFEFVKGSTEDPLGLGAPDMSPRYQRAKKK